MRRIKPGKPQVLREINCSIILGLVNKGSISRAEISRITGISPSTVSKIISSLIQKGIIREAGFYNSIGRKPKLLELNPEGAYIIGVDLQTDKISVAPADLSTSILDYKEGEIKPDESSERILCKMASFTEEMLSSYPEVESKLLGIGVSTPGPTDPVAGVVEQSPNLPFWENVPVRSCLSERFNLPVFVDNEIRMIALAERWFGAGKGHDNLVCIDISAGVGSGVILDGKLYQGVSGSAGEIGHTTVDPNGPKCGCGNRGCLEVMCSNKALVRYVLDAIARGERTKVVELAEGKLERITPSLIIETCKAGDLVALEALEKVSFWLGIGVANAINTYNPSAVIISGEIITECQEIVLRIVREVVNDRALKAAVESVEILPSQLGPKARMLGAILSVINAFFSDPSYMISNLEERSWSNTR